MNQNNNQIHIIILLVTILLISIITSFAYFTANISGSETGTTITVTGGKMDITYSGGADIIMNNIYPREEVWGTKKFTITGNSTTNLDMQYSLILVVEENTFTSSALKYKLISTNTGDNGKVVPSKTELNNILHGTREINLGTGTFTSPTSGDKVHTYNLEIYFPDSGKSQNEDQGKTFKAYLKTVEGDNNLGIPEYYVMATDDDFTVYTIKDWVYDAEVDNWIEIDSDIFQYTGSDDYVIIPEYINGDLVTSAYGMFGFIQDNNWVQHYASTVKGVATLNSNVIVMRGMFEASESTSLELKYLDTSNVTDMSDMFSYSQATSLDLSSFDTSKVTDMGHMFSFSQATSLDLAYFDTSNVTYMSSMFSFSEAVILDLSSFETSKVDDMSWMFFGSQATNLDLSSFDTSNVIHMSNMFNYSQATSLDLSTFDTSNAIHMDSMFNYSQATSLDLSSFDTSKVTNMTNMFNYSQAASLDLSSFDTSNVVYMEGMFASSQATSLELSNWDTSNVIYMGDMFASSQVTILDLSSFDTSNVTDMSQMFYNIPATTGYARTQEDADRFHSSSLKPSELNFIVK